jgi:hypothetical protein
VRLAVVLILAGCSRSSLISRASERLGVTGEHLVLVANEDMHGVQYFEFCRDERRPDDQTRGPIGDHAFDDPACVVYWCPSGEDGPSCHETIKTP